MKTHTKLVSKHLQPKSLYISKYDGEKKYSEDVGSKENWLELTCT